LLKQLREQGFDKVVIGFAGSGDEGSIHDIDGYTNGSAVSLWDHPGIESWAYSLVEDDKVDFDWVNNEGGGGTATIDVATGRVEWDRFYYEQTTVPLDPLITHVRDEDDEDEDEDDEDHEDEDLKALLLKVDGALAWIAKCLEHEGKTRIGHFAFEYLRMAEGHLKMVLDLGEQAQGKAER
jgi:hypothetical protein